MFLNYFNAFLKFGTMSRGFLKCPEISVVFVIRPFLLIRYYVRDVSTGATDATEVAPKFLDTLTLSPPGGQILPTIAEVASKFSPW